MAIAPDGSWRPDIFERQREAMEACWPSFRNMVLLSGPRLCGKTVACHHAMCQHAWNTNRGNMCLLTVTQSAGADSGPWEHLTTQYIPQWIGNSETGEGGNFGMDWIRKPFIANNSKKPTCIVRNRFGNETKITLESLAVEDEVEERFKGKEYSCIWVNELSKFTKRKTFDTLKLCFRGGWKPEECLFLSDTNPSEEGTASWIYKLWYDLANAPDDEIGKVFPDIEDPKILIPLRNSLRLIEFGIDDNMALTVDQKSNLLSTLAHDQDLVARYWHGKWITASTDALFYEQFRPRVHCIPELASPVSDPEPEIMMPEEGCRALGVGWDPGDSVNSAAEIYEKTMKVMDVVKGEDGTYTNVITPVVKFLDEVVKVGKSHNIEDFVREVMRRMAFWEDVIECPGRTTWTHWSDRSVFERQSTESQRFLAQVIYEASALAIRKREIVISSPIILQAAGRGPGTLGGRVDLWRRLLFDNRLFFSRHFCPKLIDANKSLRKPPTGAALIQKGSIHKHPWDAASYAVTEECYDEMAKTVIREIRRERKKRSTIVSISTSF